MRAFTSPLKQLKEFDDICKSTAKNRGVIQVSGCIDTQKAHMIFAMSENVKNKIIITYNDLKAKELFEDYQFFDKNVLLYPAKDLIFYSADVHGNLIVQQRMEVLKAILENRGVTIITTIAGCMEHMPPITSLKESIKCIKNDSVIDVDKLKKELISMGYERAAQVEGPGQFAIRGGIIDVFPLTSETPFRIELWGDEVDSLRSFDRESQRSLDNLEAMEIYPASEFVMNDARLKEGLKRLNDEAKGHYNALREDRKTEEAARIRHSVEEFTERMEMFNGDVGIDTFIRYFFPETVSFLDYFKTEETLVFIDESHHILEVANVKQKEFQESMIHRLEKGYVLPGQVDILYPYKEIIVKCNKMNCISLCTLEQKQAEWAINERYNIQVKAVNPYNNSFELLTKDLLGWKKAGYKMILLSSSRTRAERLAEDLREYDLNSFYTNDYNRLVEEGEIMVTHGHTHRGYEYPFIKFVVISESDIFGNEKKKKKKRKVYEGQKIQSFSELSVGDYVVHENHGLGIYRGIEKVEVEHVTKDYMKIEYGGGGSLYIPATQLDLIQKYAGADAKKPKLNRLGSVEWNKTKSRVRSAVQDIAKELVELYAIRQNKIGFVYGEDTVWQAEFEELFPHDETEDQLLAIEDTKRDMESTKVMDRLICGDVGYGKTEIAIRAAFKAVQEGKQVVYLVPTTILAQQHYNTFVQRMKDFPIEIELLSRFRSSAEQRKTLQRLKKGTVDIVLGTHRLLSKDVVIKNLGLLVVDEEQRFGVSHKEKIKQLKENVDVLTLTATPIPRTLHMSLIGIRDMSVLEEPPMERMPIQTYVLEYNEEMVREAIVRELARQGQVYYVFNRINGIDEMANVIAKLVPDAVVAFAHGQMKESDLERIMYEFINGEIDVLVSTTIIETGLDISNVNTMIIHDADNLGLSQLYQLRGRVGRSNRTSYAFLLYRRNKMLKEVAEKRLQAIREFTDLGSGFKIAMKDLEIRGAGNLLGSQQHGHMEAVGYDMYCKMLNEAVKQLKGVSVQEDFNTAIDIDIDAFIPEKYIRSEFQKLDIYKRIAGIENQEEYDDILEELIDRFGEPPKSVQNLLFIAKLKAVAHGLYFKEIKQKGKYFKMVLYEKANIEVSQIPELLEKYKSNLIFKIETNPFFTYYVNAKNTKENRDVLQQLQALLEDMAVCLKR
jgi:transcription-repair coupling factor (mfd)